MHVFSSFKKYGTVTPHDSNELIFNALYIGVTGNVEVQDEDGNNTIFTNVPVGFFPVSGQKVRATGTTATGIIYGLW